MSLYSVSHLTAAIAFTGLMFVTLTRWRTRLSGSMLASAMLLEVVWASVAVMDPGLRIAILTDIGRAGGWLVVLVRCLPRNSARRSLTERLRAPLTLLAAGLVVAAALDVILPQEIGASGLQRLQAWLGLLSAIAGLLVVEQVAKNTRASQSWELKYVWLAIGGLFAYDLCLWTLYIGSGTAAAALLVARGLVNAVLAFLLATGLSRVSTWNSGRFLSPRIAFFNTTLIGAGIYAIVMAAISYAIRVFGASWGAVVQIVFLAGATILLAAMLLSEQIRAWTRVMVAKYLLPYQYDYRSEWLRLTHAVSATGDTPFGERVVRVLAEYVNSASGGLWTRNRDDRFAPAGGNFAGPDSPTLGSDGFLDSLRDSEWICDLDDCRSGVAPPQMPPPPQWLLDNPRAWLVVPLVCEGELTGFVVIGRPLVVARLGWEQIDILRASSRQIASFLAFEQSTRHVAELRQFEAFNRLSAVLMHDLRHLVAQQALVVENAAKHRHNPAFIDDAIVTIEHSVKRMSRLMEQLRSGTASDVLRRVDLVEVATEVVRRASDRLPTPELATHHSPIEVQADPERLLHCLSHLVRNAQEATPPAGRVTVTLRHESQFAMLEVADTGCGMTAEFIRDRLFAPFDTTKGTVGMGIGAYEVRDYVRKCGGSVFVESIPGKGTTFTMRLPLHRSYADN